MKGISYYNLLLLQIAPAYKSTQMDSINIPILIRTPMKNQMAQPNFHENSQPNETC